MKPAGGMVQEEPLRGAKTKVSPWRRPCATSSAVRRQQVTAWSSAATLLCDMSVTVAVSSHSSCSRLRPLRKPVSRTSQQKRSCIAISTHAHANSTPLAAQLACASLPTWNGFIACVGVEKEVTMCEPNALSSQRFPCRQ